MVPDAKRHLVNNLYWINVMREQGPKLKGGFRGIALTGICYLLIYLFFNIYWFEFEFKNG